MKHTEYAFALTRDLPCGKSIIYKRYIRSARKTLISDAVAGFYDGDYDWEKIRKRGWRVVKIKISVQS